MDPNQIPAAVVSVLTPYMLKGEHTLSAGQPSGEPADLEISLHQRSGSDYSVEMRFSPPGSATETRLGANELVEISFEFEELQRYARRGDWKGYGRSLSDSLFEPQAVKMALVQAVARAGNGPLRLRLLFGPTAQNLHTLRWETLRHPLDGTMLAANQNLLFSRYLSGGEKEAHPRLKGQVRALAAAANPQGLEQYDMAPVDVGGELTRARESLQGFQLVTLPSDTMGCTLAGLVRHLQEGFDILYLAAHGNLLKGQAWLWLEGEQGQVQRVSGIELADQVRLLEKPPLLVVLASCQSAGDGEGNALQALGPLLCDAGVAAVIAMQDNISMKSIAAGMPVFFEQLQRDGLVDRALAASRAALVAEGANDAWMPALFMRLKEGSIWRVSGEVAPEAVGTLWRLILAKFEGRPAASGAASDYAAQPDDSDNQDAFTIQLKKSLREDQQFSAALAASLEAAQKSSAGGSTGGIVISVGGNVGGNIVLGNNNVIGSNDS